MSFVEIVGSENILEVVESRSYKICVILHDPLDTTAAVVELFPVDGDAHRKL